MIFEVVISLLVTVASFWAVFSFFKSRFLEPNGRSVLITGCDSGIGQRVAIHLLEQGFEVFAGCLDVESPSSAPLRGIRSENLHLLSLDVTSTESVEKAFNLVRDKLQSKKLWGLVNNAGICVFGEFEWLNMDQCRNQIEVNLLGTVRVTKTFLPLIRKAKGRIVNVTSVNGDIVYPGLSVYCASKFALEALSTALRYELKKFQVSVSVVRPGDFARLTNIMKNHGVHVQTMWNDMNEEQKETYQDYFQNFHDVALANYGITSYKSMESSPLLKDVTHALLSPTPKIKYVCAPWVFKVFFLLLKFLPTFLSDSLIITLFKPKRLVRH